jgi:hypothetical protein
MRRTQGDHQPDAVRRWPDCALRLNLPKHSIYGSGRSHFFSALHARLTVKHLGWALPSESGQHGA